MLKVLSKVFILSFYRANSGFFLFFFFIFFGAVEGSSLISYHLSLINSVLRSGTVLLLFFCCWTLYHIKCVSFFLQQLNGAEGSFLMNLQTLPAKKHWLVYSLLYMAVYSPVFVYSLVIVFVALYTGYAGTGFYVLLFQACSVTFFSGLIFYRSTHWMESIHLPSFRWRFSKTFLLLVFYHLTIKKKPFLLALKFFSLALLYSILVWNRGKYDNDSFLLFYLVLLLAHAAIPYQAVQFFEQQFAVYRNLPISIFKIGMAFLLPYLLLMIPEMVYIFYQGDAITPAAKIGYSLNLLASLAFLTAIQYSGVHNRDEYMKATFAMIFISIFMLHEQAFGLWIGVQVAISVILFYSGYRRYEKVEES